MPASMVYALDGGRAAYIDLERGSAWQPTDHAPRLGAFRLIGRDVVAYGFMRYGGQAQPFTATLRDGALLVTFGRRPTGWDGRPGLTPIKPRLENFPATAAGYGYFPGGTGPIGPLVKNPAFRPFLSLLDAVGRPAEILFNASTTAEFGTDGFIIHGPGGGDKGETDAIESAVTEFFGFDLPEAVPVTLEDGTETKELRHVPAKKLGSMRLKTGTLHRYGHEEAPAALYYDDIDGTWIGSEVRNIQSAIISGITYGEARDAGPCPAHPLDARLVIIPEHAMRMHPTFFADSKLIPMFSRVEISLQDAETGLFTICGQF
jgi:hypothetical protein